MIPARGPQTKKFVRLSACKLCNAINAMQSMLCNQCYAIYAMQSMLCNLCYAIYAMHPMLCDPCYAIYAMQRWTWKTLIVQGRFARSARGQLQFEEENGSLGMQAMQCNQCYAINAMQSMLCNLCYATVKLKNTDCPQALRPKRPWTIAVWRGACDDGKSGYTGCRQG